MKDENFGIKSRYILIDPVNFSHLAMRPNTTNYTFYSIFNTSSKTFDKLLNYIGCNYDITIHK